MNVPKKQGAYTGRYDIFDRKQLFASYNPFILKDFLENRSFEIDQKRGMLLFLAKGL